MPTILATAHLFRLKLKMYNLNFFVTFAAFDIVGMRPLVHTFFIILPNEFYSPV